MTHFFALPDETEVWLSNLVERLDLVRRDRALFERGRQVFLWPRRDTDLLPPGAYGVMVMYPELWPETLTMGSTGWKASAFDADTAEVGRRLSGQITRSLRKWTTTPLYGVSWDGYRGAKPFAWASASALETTVDLRQFRTGAVTFVP